MANIINNKKLVSPELIEKQFQGLLWKYVRSFMRDPNLRRLEEPQGLYNIMLMKLYTACRDFVYEDRYTEHHNELRFIALLRTYVRNSMIDEQYAQNAKRRSGAKSTVSIELDLETESGAQPDPYWMEDKSSIPPEESAHERDIKEKIRSRLIDEDVKIFDHFCEGYPAERIAGKLGILIPRVRHALYSRIQPVVSEVVNGKPLSDDT